MPAECSYIDAINAFKNVPLASCYAAAKVGLEQRFNLIIDQLAELCDSTSDYAVTYALGGAQNLVMSAGAHTTGETAVGVPATATVINTSPTLPMIVYGAVVQSVNHFQGEEGVQSVMKYQIEIDLGSGFFVMEDGRSSVYRAVGQDGDGVFSMAYGKPFLVSVAANSALTIRARASYEVLDGSSLMSFGLPANIIAFGVAL